MCATTWMKLEDDMLSEINQSRKARPCRILSLRSLGPSNPSRQKVGCGGASGWRGGGELVFNGDRVLVLQEDRSSTGGQW
jgi:hypothetical protein